MGEIRNFEMIRCAPTRRISAVRVLRNAIRLVHSCLRIAARVVSRKRRKVAGGLGFENEIARGSFYEALVR